MSLDIIAILRQDLEEWCGDAKAVKQLLDAARRCDAAEVKRLILGTDNIDRTRFHRVCMRLARFRIPINDANDSGQALWMAAGFGYVDAVRLLLKEDLANPEFYCTAALGDAIKYSNVKVVRALLKDGRADPTADPFGEMAFYRRKGSAETVALLERAIPVRRRWNSRSGTVYAILQVLL